MNLASYTTEDEHVLFYRRLRAARTLAGLTQVQVAEQLSGEASMISMIERGQRSVDERWLRALSKIYGVPVGWFFGEGAAP